MLFAMFYAQIYILTCLYVQIYMLYTLCHVYLCFVLFLFQVDVRVTCSHACIMLLAMPCLDLCVFVFISMLYGQIIVFTCLYAWIHVLPCLCVKFLHVHMRVSMPICLDLCFHILMCLNLCFLHVLCHLPCACVLHAMFVCIDLGYVCHAMCYCSPFVALSFLLVFWPISSDSIQTLWSLSLSIHLGPYQRVWITLFAGLYWLASMLYACVSLSCSRLCHV